MDASKAFVVRREDDEVCEIEEMPRNALVIKVAWQPSLAAFHGKLTKRGRLKWLTSKSGGLGESSLTAANFFRRRRDAPQRKAGYERAQRLEGGGPQI